MLHPSEAFYHFLALCVTVVLESVVENVTLDGVSGVVNVLVLAKRKNMERAAVFQNVRVFIRQGENWKLIMWVNTKIWDL